MGLISSPLGRFPSFAKHARPLLLDLFHSRSPSPRIFQDVGLVNPTDWTSTCLFERASLFGELIFVLSESEFITLCERAPALYQH